jgi:hypothetical protein
MKMKNSLTIALGTIVGVLALCGLATLCLFTLALLVSTPTPTPAPVGIIPHETSIPSLTSTPSPQKFGASVTYGNIRITLISYEFSGPYQDIYHFTKRPAEGAQFLWVHVRAENIGKTAETVPDSSAFSLIYEDKQTDTGYFSPRPGYAAYSGGQIFPGVARDGWIRFEVPTQMDAKKSKIVLKPNLFSGEFFTWSLAP